MKRVFGRALALAFVAGTAASVASGQSISTTFANNNNGAALWTNYFDITINSPTTISKFDINTNGTTGIGIDVYVTAAGGTYVGNESNAAAWTLVGTGTGTGAGLGVPSPVDTSDFLLGPGTYGMAIRFNANTVPYYTNGTGANQTYSNADITLQLGSSQATTVGPFNGGTPFTPRVWNGTIYYALGGVVGACCLPNLTCVSTTSSSCTNQGGTYRGDGVTCAQANCPTPGACCLLDGSCIQTTSAACTTQQGLYRGDSTLCSGANCPQPTPGACCLPDGTCSSLTGPACLAQNGLFGGAGVACGAANCAKGYAYNGQAIPIPDGLGSTECGTDVFAEVTVPDSFTIGGVEASFHIAHTFQGDVSISLEKVGGPTVVLVDRPGVPAAAFGFGNDNYGGGTANAQRFISTDAATNIYDAPATAGVDNPSGRWKSENSKAIFNGLNSAGAWRLHAKDCAGADTGSIIAFTLLLKGPAGTTSCYANCDNSTVTPCLNVNDFTCFLNAYGANLAYANCDASTLTPVLNVNDFTCFLNRYSAGCGANNCSPRP